MENNILGGLTGLPPNIPTSYWTQKDGNTAILNDKLLSVNKNKLQNSAPQYKTYIVNQNIMGVDFSKDGGAKVVVFKKGDKVESNKIGNDPDFQYGVQMVVPQKGIFVRNPTLPKSSGIIYDVFIPLYQVTEVASSTNEPTSTNTDVVTIPKNQLLQYAVIGLILYIVFIK